MGSGEGGSWGGVSGKKERTMYRYRDRKVCSWVVVSAMGQTGKAG